jgi:D-alanyl-D-alanine carboxypeptidase/D-alanyl-D-alanine-endopeptidase (penicillin-binding protein 4)
VSGDAEADDPAEPDHPTPAAPPAGGPDPPAEADGPAESDAPDPGPDEPADAAAPGATAQAAQAAHDGPDEAAGPTAAAEPDVPVGPGQAARPSKPAAATVPDASDEAPAQPGPPAEADGTDSAPVGAAGAAAPAEPAEAAEPAEPVDEPAQPDAAAPSGTGASAGTDELAEPAEAADEAPEPAGAAAGRPRRSPLVRWLLPLALAATTAASALGAITLDADEASSAVGARGAAATPLLSARRAPEVLAEPVAARRLTADLRGWLAQSPPDTCLVVDDAGQHVFEHNPTTPLAGASTQKLLTSTALLLALGADATLETTAVAADAPARGVIDGHLYMVGGGDALLATRSWRDHFRRQPRTIADIEQLAQAVVDAGVTRITGSVIGDASRYESQTYHPAWPRRFFDDREIGPIGGLMVNDGFASFPSAATPGAPTLPSTNVGADAANILSLALRVRGVEVVGPPRSGSAPEDAAEVATMPSLPVRDIVAEMLTDSDNETAEAALKEVGHAESGEGSWAAGAAAATELLSGAGVTMDGVEVVDGSGLSIRNQLTCTTLVDVLTSPDTGQVVREGLAVAGETGTLATRWDGTPADGRLRAKTGTLRNVTALAGEIDVADGDTVTFAYVANVADPGQISSDLAALQPAAATQPGAPPAG